MHVIEKLHQNLHSKCEVLLKIFFQCFMFVGQVVFFVTACSYSGKKVWLISGKT